MCKVLYTRFSSLSDYVVSFNEGGICYYVPKEPLSIGVFANDNNLFVVDSLVYLCVSSNIMSFPFELDSLRSFGEFLHYAKDTSIYSKIIDYNHNQEPWYPLRTDIDYPWRSYFLRNGDHAAKVTIRTIENLRMHGAVRTITANVQSFHIHDGCATLSNCFGKVDGEVTTYNEVRENVFTDHFRKGNRLMKDYSFTIACHNVDSARSSYVDRNLLQINFSNTHGVHGEYKP